MSDQAFGGRSDHAATGVLTHARAAVDGDGEPLLVLHTSEFLADAIFARERPVDPLRYCHRPIVVRDPGDKLGRHLPRDRVASGAVGTEVIENDVIEHDVIVVWGEQPRIITGTDILRRLVHATPAHAPAPALDSAAMPTRAGGDRFSHLEVAESPDRLEISSPMRVGLRIALAAMGAVPLLAPYELLVRVDWRDVASPAFAFAALVSLGAVAVSALFVVAAVAGTSSSIVVDRRAGTISFASQAPITPRSMRTFPVGDVAAVELGVHEWSDGGPSYHVHVAMADGRTIRTGPSPSRDEIEAVRARLASFLPETAPAATGRADA
jgi:hypothetical protein